MSEAEMKPYRVTMRDRIAYRIANWVLLTFATREYKAFLSVLYARGKNSLDRYLEIGVEK